MLDRKSQIAYALLKKAGLTGDAARAMYAAGKGFLGSGSHISRTMAEQGVRSPVAHFAAKAAPYAVTALGLKKGWESDPVQRARYRYAVWKQRRAMEQAQRGFA